MADGSAPGAEPGSAIPPGVLDQIRAQLAEIERVEEVRLLLAVESGSRAWGFPSPDSDYDVRFVYARRPDWYVSVHPGRDVIEAPLGGPIDLNGWDLRKALGLMLKGNAVLVEWLTSPVVYGAAPGFREGLSELALRHTRRLAFVHHYLHLGESMRDNRHLRRDRRPIKKYFYTLRPAAALRWLRLHGAERLPPMHFPTLVAECDLPGPTRAIIADLVARKAVTRELGDTEPIPELETLVDQEFAAARRTLAGPEAPRDPGLGPAADGFLRRWVFGPEAGPGRG